MVLVWARSVMRVVAVREWRWRRTVSLGLVRALGEWRWRTTRFGWTSFMFVWCRDGRVLSLMFRDRWRGGRPVVATMSVSSTTVLERLEWPLTPRVVVRFGCLIIAVATKGRVVEALTLEVCHEVPERGGVVVVAYVRHDCCC
jgi:hypothetical protein